MPHLSLDTLARLVDEKPERDEAAHLAACDLCRDELRALNEQRSALGMLPDVLPPPDQWSAIRDRLAREGLVRRQRDHGWLRTAAAAVLFVLGGASGWAMRGAPAAEMPSVAGSGSDVAAPASSTPEQVTRELARAQDEYLAALTRYLEVAEPQPSDPAARLATLDDIVLTTREALSEAPADPVINGYHLTALAQRDAMLRQISLTSSDPWF